MTTLFNTLISQATAIDYNPKWANGTGYFNGITYDESLYNKGNLTFVDNDNRRGLIFTTDKGSVVIFERFPHGENGVLVSNSPHWKQDRAFANFEPITNTSSSITDDEQIQNALDAVVLIRQGKTSEDVANHFGWVDPFAK